MCAAGLDRLLLSKVVVGSRDRLFMQSSNQSRTSLICRGVSAINTSATVFHRDHPLANPTAPDGTSSRSLFKGGHASTHWRAWPISSAPPGAGVALRLGTYRHDRGTIDSTIIHSKDCQWQKKKQFEL
jgi:hypothetical protein